MGFALTDLEAPVYTGTLQTPQRKTDSALIKIIMRGLINNKKNVFLMLIKKFFKLNKDVVAVK